MQPHTRASDQGDAGHTQPNRVNPDVRTFQQRVAAWVTATFGQTPAQQRDTRAYRALEEALEAAQCSGVTQTQAHQLTAHVYSRPPGERSSEYGASLLTLAALADAYGHDLLADAEAELTRISAPDLMARCRAKHAARDPNSALPGAPIPTDSADQILRDLHDLLTDERRANTSWDALTDTERARPATTDTQRAARRHHLHDRIRAYVTART